MHGLGLRDTEHGSLSDSWAYCLCYSVSCYGCMFASIMLDLVLQYWARRLPGMNVPVMSCFVIIP